MSAQNVSSAAVLRMASLNRQDESCAQGQKRLVLGTRSQIAAPARCHANSAIRHYLLAKRLKAAPTPSLQTYNPL